MNKKGSAYIMIVIVSTAVITLILTALSIAKTSRETTLINEKHFGLYDLAVAGNEQIFYFISEKVLEHRSAAINESEKNGTTFAEEMTKILREEFEIFEFVYNEFYRHEWNFSVKFSTLQLQDEYSAETTIHFIQGGFDIITRIRKHNNGIATYDTVVRSRIKFLDDYTVKMVELLRI